jgi:carotenoid cleavage dioxygenase-like enzyme
VICQDFDAEAVASSFLLFDAYHVAAGPVARLPLKHPVPLCFHASWAPKE